MTLPRTWQTIFGLNKTEVHATCTECDWKGTSHTTARLHAADEAHKVEAVSSGTYTFDGHRDQDGKVRW